MAIKPLLYELEYFPDPVTVYGFLRNEPYSSFLDSAMDHEKLGRFSFIGYDPFMVVETKGEDITALTQDGTEKFKANPFDFLKSLLSYYKTESPNSEIPFTSGCIGYFSYDMRYFIEELPSVSTDDIALSDITLSFYDTVFIFDNLLKKAYISSSGLPHLDVEKNAVRAASRLESAKKYIYSIPLGTFSGAETACGESGFDHSKISSNFTKDEYRKAIRKAKDYIKEGDIYQVNLSQRLSTEFSGDSFELYKTLRRINPAPFAAYLNYENFQIVSASPERFLKLNGKDIETRPIKGTRPRGVSEKEDARLKKELITSEKDRAEHLMIVDLERNDIGRVCEYGSVAPTEFIITETYSTVHHLVSTVSGKLKDGVSVADCLMNCFPGGSITGAPKIRAMEIIEELEPAKRGIYTGSIGYIDFSGNSDLSIVIRTVIVTLGTAYFQVGGGIVADSDADKEFNETMDKARAIIEAIGIEKAKLVAVTV
ncbi:MAG: aminodeoxychorismate synthase component I [Candidatus Omnitrophica bacterium]|nr:aminodeoxychorismate synthase component I [Candidatus Omnitrophota bacterium]MBU4487517.1 aminodeoxychorismate synthase component I [Candidatus Omnitrophota bacterium]MCG2704895.1 aminodeoxychorismate synthase component I [Candidatus Omnitrophota bacterium]